MSIALTGASGQLGRLVVEDLLARGVPADQIVAIVRDPAKVTDFADRGIVVRQADYADPHPWHDALDGVRRLLLISISGAGASAAHRTVIDNAVTAGVGFVAYTSVLHADTSTNPVAGEHAATEKLIAASGIPARILRNAWYHEYYTRQLPGYLATGTVLGATGGARVSGAARADLAAAAAAVLVSGGTESHTYELGGPSFTLAELAEAITAISGIPVVHRDLTEAEYIRELQASGMDLGWARKFAESDASIAAGMMQTDSNDLAQLIGRPPRTLTETLRQVAGTICRTGRRGR